MYEELIQRLREAGETLDAMADFVVFPNLGMLANLMNEAVNAIEVLSKTEKTTRWIPVAERLPECEWGAEVGNIEWISCGMVFAGCFGRGGKYRDAYFRTWTDGTEGIDAKDADYWRQIQIPEPPKEGE